jgi:hypothetical protein
MAKREKKPYYIEILEGKGVCVCVCVDELELVLILRYKRDRNVLDRFLVLIFYVY